MLDINRIRANPEAVRQALLKRIREVDFSELLSWDEEYRRNRTELEQLQSRRNRVSSEIPQLKKQGADVTALLEEMKQVNAGIKERDARDAELQKKIGSFLEGLPNIPADDVKAGGKENNEVVHVWGRQPEFSFKPRDHIELAELLGIVDYARGVKLGGNGFWIFMPRQVINGEMIPAKIGRRHCVLKRRKVCVWLDSS